MNRGLSRRALLGASATGLLAGALEGAVAQSPGAPAARPGAPDFSGATGWLGSSPLRLQDLHGKVVLVQFWTFTCVNWQRTLPFVQAWSAKYADAGLVVVGVHTPEFSFEHDWTNVHDAREQLGIRYPVAVDSDQAVWNSFGNNAWPALYLFDARGGVRHRHEGEGAYELTESWIQRLLAESGAAKVPGGRVQVEGRGAQAAADWPHLRSPETYTGYRRADRFHSPGGIAADRQRTYERPTGLPTNAWAVDGAWTFGGEAARTEAPQARLAYRFHARDVNLVAGATRRNQPVPFRVRVDGEAPGDAHGSDTDADGRGVFAERRLYQLVRVPGSIRERDIEIEFLGPSAEVYVFTFG